MSSRSSSNTHIPSPKEAALLLLSLFEAKRLQGTKPLTRARLSTTTLKTLWNRKRLNPEFLRDVEEWLLHADWALIDCGTVFAAVRVSAVANWPRVSSKHIRDDVIAASQGRYDFSPLERLMVGVPADNQDAED